MNDGTEAGIGVSGRDAVLMHDDRLIAVALLEPQVWQPFVRDNRTKSNATLRGLDGRVLATCRLGRKGT